MLSFKTRIIIGGILFILSLALLHTQIKIGLLVGAIAFFLVLIVTSESFNKWDKEQVDRIKERKIAERADRERDIERSDEEYCRLKAIRDAERRLKAENYDNRDFRDNRSPPPSLREAAFDGEPVSVVNLHNKPTSARVFNLRKKRRGPERMF